MQTVPQRSIEIDFFRGLALLVIVVDHISGSTLAHVTLHAYAQCDTSEVFVFAGGFAAASAFRAMEARHDAGAAARRFYRRAGEIYFAYLITAALMLIISWICACIGWHAAALAWTGWSDWLAHPREITAQILALRRQPYLSSILPMYALYALAVPLLLPWVRTLPVRAFVVSLLVWAFAPALGRLLPSAEAAGWSFNPFAWQLVFVLGALARTQRIDPAFFRTRRAAWLTGAAVALTLFFAFCKLVLETQPPPGYMKQDLAALRVVNFVALAWLAAGLVRGGVVARLAGWSPAVVRVGQEALVCFVAGSGISLLADACLTTLAQAVAPKVAGLAVDVCALGATFGVAGLSRRARLRRQARAVPQPRALDLPGAHEAG